MQAIPDDLLREIFSYLRVGELFLAAQASRRFRSIADSEMLWQRHCLNYFEGAQPIEGSWRARFQVIRNWRHLKAEVRQYVPTPKAAWRSYAVLDSGLVYNVEARNPPFTLMHMSNLTAQAEKRIDLTQFKVQKVIAVHLRSNRWFVLEQEGVILCFNVLDGRLLKQITTNLPSNIGRLELFGEELLIRKRDRIQIYNYDSGKCLHDELTDQFTEPLDYLCTNNFLLHFQTIADIRQFNVEAVSRIVEHTATFEFDGFLCEKEGVDSEGTCVAMLGKDGSVLRFIDQKEKLACLPTLQFTVSVIDDHSKGSLRFHKNWLLVNQYGTLIVIDFKSGATIARLNHLCSKIECYTNGTLLFMRTTQENQKKLLSFNFANPSGDARL